jgi:hypothetical protein
MEMVNFDDAYHMILVSYSLDLAVDDAGDQRAIALEAQANRCSSNVLDVLELWLANTQWNCF